MTGGGGVERLSRRMLAEAEALAVPTVPDPDVEPLSRVELARACGIEPDDWQRAALESDAHKLLFCCARQTGKSTTSGLLAVHEAAFSPGSLTLMLAPSLRQSGELFRTTLRLLKQVHEAGVTMPAIVMESALRAELANGSRVIALPGAEATVRGYSAATLVIIDEASRVSDELIAAVRPALATTNGRCVALSTPAGRRGWFYREWSQGEGWERTRVTASECPRISPAFLADERRQLGEFTYSQEYELAFLDPTSSVFSSALIERALCAAVHPFHWSTP